MFTWICPQCKREVPPSYTECPDCAKKTAEAAPAAVAAAPPAPEVAAAPPPPVAALPPPPPPAAPPGPPEIRPVRSSILFASAPPLSQPAAAAAPPATEEIRPVRSSILFAAAAPASQPAAAAPQYPPQPRGGLPTWLLTIVFTFAFVGLGAGIYWTIQHFKGGEATAAAPAAAVESVPANPNAKPHPMQKFVEVSGVRLFQDAKKQVEARFVLVNHSEAELSDLGGTVDIRGRTAKEGEEPVGTFKFANVSLGPNESKEVTAHLDTKLKVYELPDWQLVDARLQITAP